MPRDAMNASFKMTPDVKKFLCGNGGKAEYVVFDPINISVEFKSGKVIYPQEIRERIVRCRDCVYCEEGPNGSPECRKLLFAGEFLSDAPIPLGPCPDGFCAWGEERDQ